MKENLEHKLRIFQIFILNTKLRLQISQKVVCEKFYAHKKSFTCTKLLPWIYQNLLFKKLKENM